MDTTTSVQTTTQIPEPETVNKTISTLAISWILLLVSVLLLIYCIFRTFKNFKDYTFIFGIGAIFLSFLSFALSSASYNTNKNLDKEKNTLEKQSNITQLLIILILSILICIISVFFTRLSFKKRKYSYTLEPVKSIIPNANIDV
jgi:carbon starvation protein CstA